MSLARYGSPTQSLRCIRGLCFSLSVALTALASGIVRPSHATVQSRDPVSREDKAAALKAAIESLDADGIQAALEAGADPNARFNRPRTNSIDRVAAVAMRHSVANPEQDPTEIEESILKAYAALITGGAAMPKSRDLLTSHAMLGHATVIDFLITNGADPNIANDSRETPLLVATYHGKQQVIDVLHKSGVKPFSPESVRQIKLLSAVATEDLLRVVELIDQGADVNWQDPSGRRALVHAIDFGRDWVDTTVKILIRKGADPNLTGRSVFSSWITTPLHISVLKGTQRFGPSSDAVIAELIAAGAHVSSDSDSDLGRTPLHYAASVNNVSAAKLLLEAGAKVMPRDNENRTPIELAESGEMIKLLKAHGATEN